MYVLSCFPSFGHRRSRANVVAQRDPVGLWMVNHRLPSNFYNEVDGDCIKILGGVISICGNVGKPQGQNGERESAIPFITAHYGRSIRCPRSPEPKSICVPTSLYKAPVIQTQLWIGSRWNHLHGDTTFGGEKKLQGVLYPWIGLLAYRIEIDKHSA